MLFTLKDFVTSDQAAFVAFVLKMNGRYKVFAKIGNWKKLAVPGFSQADLNSLTRWMRSVIEVYSLDASSGIIEAEFADVDTVLV